MRLTPAWILGSLVVIAPVAAILVASQLPHCPLFDVDTAACRGGWIYLPIAYFAFLSPLMFGTLAVIAARPSSTVWSRARRALLVLLAGLATFVGVPAVAFTTLLVALDTTAGLTFFLPAVALLAIGVQGLIELWVDVRPSRSADVSAT